MNQGISIYELIYAKLTLHCELTKFGFEKPLKCQFAMFSNDNWQDIIIRDSEDAPTLIKIQRWDTFDLPAHYKVIKMDSYEKIKGLFDYLNNIQSEEAILFEEGKSIFEI